ncbi:head-tail connector protein [Jannaschia formosa]|uniref:head-tail connector protein n=1 Tax=Jannaschia formosa TaxID=2259592 RepID=UPI000E1BCF06|nr:hypothetical protein [Jannaschia formosa]TFL16427.1 hypothetical protein DR046_20110 [Jannaschia formosa]
MVWAPRDRIVEVADSTGPVVSLDDLKQIRRIDHDDEDMILQGMERAATAAVERVTQRLLLPRQVVLRLTCLPSRRTPIGLYGGKVQTLTSVVADGAAIEGAQVFGDSPALLVPAADWPTVTGEGFPVTITYTAGVSTVPPDLVQAIKIMVGAMDFNREAVVMNATVAEVPLGFDYLVSPHRIRPI